MSHPDPDAPTTGAAASGAAIDAAAANTGSALHLLPGAAIAQLDTGDAPGVIRALGERLLRSGCVAPTFVDAAITRELRYPTGLPTAVPTAIPHTDPEHVLTPGIAVATLASPVPFGEMGSAAGTTVDVRLVVMLALQDASTQLTALQNLMRLLQDVDGVQQLLAADDDVELTRQVEDWLARP